jgi:halocyanin-like protein
MSDRSEDVSRRGFLMATAGGAAAAGVAGTAAAQETTQTGGTATANGTATNGTATNGTSAPEGTEGGGGGGGGTPDFGGYLDGANLYNGSVADKTGQSTVTVKVGAGEKGYAFDPPAVKVDNGATVQWEWTGNGGSHNVVSDEGPIDSGSPVGGTGVQYEHTFEKDGIYNYYCKPHQSLGMLGAVVVGTDYKTVEPAGGGGGGGPALPGSAKAIGVATAVVMSASLGLSYIFMKYGGDYDVDE